MPRVAGLSVAAAAGAARRSSRMSAPADQTASPSAPPSVGDGALPAAAQPDQQQPQPLSALPTPVSTASTPASSPMPAAPKTAGEAVAVAATPGRQRRGKIGDGPTASGSTAADEILASPLVPPADRRPVEPAPIRRSPRNKKQAAADASAAEGETAQATPAAAATPRRRSPAARSRAASPAPAAAATNSAPPAKKSHKRKVAEAVVTSGADGAGGADGHGRGQPSPAPAAAPSAAAAAASPLTAAPSATPAKTKLSHKKKKPPVPPVPAFTEGSPLPSQPPRSPLTGTAASPPRPAIEGAELPRPSTLLASSAVQTNPVQPPPLQQSAALRDPALPAPFAAHSPLRTQSAPSAMATKAPAMQSAQLLQSPAAMPAASPVVAATSPAAPPAAQCQLVPEERAQPRLADGCSELSLSTLQIALADVIAAASAAGADELPRARAGQLLDADRRRLLVAAALQSQESLPPFAPRRAFVQTMSLAHKTGTVGLIALPETQSHEDERMSLSHSASLSPASLVQLRARVAQWQREAGVISRPLQPQPSQRPSEQSPTAGAFDQWQRGELERQRLEGSCEAAAEEMDGAADELLLPLFAPQRAEPLVQLADDEEEEKFEVTEMELEEQVAEGDEGVAAVQTATVQVLTSPPAVVAGVAVAASVSSALQSPVRAPPVAPPQPTPSPSTPMAPSSKRPRADRSADEAAEKHAALQQQQQQQTRRQEDELLQLERQMIAQPMPATSEVQPACAFTTPAAAAAPSTPQLASDAAAAAASVARPPFSVVDSPAGGFLPAEVIHVPPSAEAFDVHRALFAALAAAGTFPALRRGGVIDSGEATLQGWPPVRVLRLLAAKWKHVAAATRTKDAGSFTASQQSDLRLAQRSYRDLQLLFHCAAVSFQLLHAGVTAANFFHMRLVRLPPWARILHSTEIGQPELQPPAQGRVGRGPSPVGASSLAHASGPMSRLDLLRPVGALLQRLSLAVMDGAVADSPKIRALMALLLRGRWLRLWQINCREIARAEAEAERETAAEAEAKEVAAAATLTVESALRARGKATATIFSAIPPVRHVTVVLVQSELTARALVSFLPAEIGAAIIDPPEPLTAAASAQQKEAAAKKQKEDLDPNTFLRLFRLHGLLIGRAGHLLPHATFPWRCVGALIHFDCLDPFLFWNADGGKVFEPSAEIRMLIGQGAVQSFSLETDTASSLILLPPDERRLRQLLLPVPATAPLRLLANRQWVQRHDDVVFGLQQSQVELVPRDLPVSLILDAQAACVALELADLINAEGSEEAAAIEQLIVYRILLAAGHFRRLFVFFFHPALPLSPDQPAAASSYSRAEERLMAAMGESLSDSPMGPVRWSARRVRGAEAMMIQLLAAINEAKKSAESGQAQSDSPTAAVLAEKAERFLSGFPGLNDHLAALFLDRAGLTVDRLFALTLEEARALAPEADEAQLRSMLTFAQTAVRPNATPPAPDQATPIAATVAEPQRQRFVPVRPPPSPRSHAQPAPGQQLPAQRKRGHDLMAERRAQTAREFAEQRGAVQQFASPQTNPLTTPPEVQPLRKRKGAIAPARPTQLPSLPLPVHGDRAVVAHNGLQSLHWPPQQPQEQPRPRPSSASSQTAHGRSGSAASSAPAVGSRPGRPPSTESQLMQGLRHEGSGAVTAGSVTGKRKISEGLIGGSSDGSGGSGSSNRRAAAAGRHSAVVPNRTRLRTDSSEGDSSADEDVPISSLLPQRAQPDTGSAAAALWTTPRPPLRSESRPIIVAQSTARPGSGFDSRPGLGSGSRSEFGSRPGSSSSSSGRRSLEAASDDHRRLMELKRGTKLRVGFGQAADPALQQQRQGVLRLRSEPLSPQRQQAAMEATERTPSPSPSPPPRQQRDHAHARRRDDEFKLEDERAHYRKWASASSGQSFERRGPRLSSTSRSASPPPGEINNDGGRLPRGYAAPLPARRDWNSMDDDSDDAAEDEVLPASRPPRALSGGRHSDGHSSVLSRADGPCAPRRSLQSRGFSPPFDIEDRSAHSERRVHFGPDRRDRSPEFGSGRGRRGSFQRETEFGEEGDAEEGESVEELPGADGHVARGVGSGPQRQLHRFEFARRPQGPIPLGQRQPQQAPQSRGVRPSNSHSQSSRAMIMTAQMGPSTTYRPGPSYQY